MSASDDTAVGVRGGFRERLGRGFDPCAGSRVLMLRRETWLRDSQQRFFATTPCLDERCEHPKGWHRRGSGSCLECGCVAFRVAA